MFERQPSAMPTNKVLTMAGSMPVTLALVSPAVQEVWPQIAPAVLSGPAMTDAMAGIAAALIGMALAWFVPDRAGQ